MTWHPRIGAAADSSPKIDQLAAARQGNFSEGHSSAQSIQQSYPFSLDGYQPEWTLVVPYAWGEVSQPTYAELDQGDFLVLKFPPEISGQGTQVLYAAQGIWPQEATHPELFAFFIDSRPAGSVSWRSNPTYLEFTPEIEALKGTDDYRFDLVTVPADEYQARARYQFQALGDEDVRGPVLAGADVPGVLFILVAELVGLPMGESGSVLADQAFQSFIVIRYFNEEDRYYSNNQTKSTNLADPFFALRADNQQQGPTQEGVEKISTGSTQLDDGVYLLFVG